MEEGLYGVEGQTRQRVGVAGLVMDGMNLTIKDRDLVACIVVPEEFSIIDDNANYENGDEGKDGLPISP
jgi:hypothetical protein